MAEKEKYDAEVLTQLAEIKKDLKNLCKTTRRIDLILTGNGNPGIGMAARTIVNENSIKNLYAKFKSFSKLHYLIGVLVIVAIIKIAILG